MKGILFDLDGVLYAAEQPVPGAAEAIRALQTHGVPHRFLTNTTTLARRDLVEKLAAFGVETDVEHIINPPYVAAQWLQAEGAEAISLFVAPQAEVEFEGLLRLPVEAENGADFVVVGDLGAAWDFATLNRAFRLLYEDRTTTLVALGMSDYWHAPDGPRLDVAPFVAALERATERRAVVLGKPAAPFFHVALQALGLPAREVIMVGDDIRTDVAAAQALGMHGILVRTGKYRPGDLARGVIADAVLDSVAALPEWWATHAGR